MMLPKEGLLLRVFVGEGLATVEKVEIRLYRSGP